jgi:hypothetical protein
VNKMKSQQPLLKNNYLLDDVNEYDKRVDGDKMECKDKFDDRSRQLDGHEGVEAEGDVRPDGEDPGEIGVERTIILLNNNLR